MTAVIGVGMAALGRPGYINLGHGEDYASATDPVAMERRAFDVLDAAYAAGVRYYDAARSYGRAEEFLAAWLRLRGAAVADQVTVASKWGYRYVADWQVDVDVHEVKQLTADNFRRQLAETRELLGDRLELYQIHSATLESGVFDDRAVLDELAQLRRSGVKIGFSTSGPQQAQTIERALQLGGFDAVQATWNLLEQSAGAALAKAHAGGLRVVVKEAVANGKLTARGMSAASGSGSGSGSAGSGEDLAALFAAARELGVTADAVALAAVLAQPWADVVLSGATTVPMLRSNLAARELALAPELLSELLERLVVEPNRYWRARSELPWN